MNAFLKGALLLPKGAPFTLQKGIFYTAKGRLLHCKRGPMGSISLILFYKKGFVATSFP